MRVLIASIVLALTAGLAHAADATCDAKAADKKLAGAAKNSFVKKCMKDTAKATCATTAADKKLAGAAKGAASSRSARRMRQQRQGCLGCFQVI